VDAQPEHAQPEVDETVVVRRDVGEAPQDGDGDDDGDDADELDETIVVGRIVSPAEPVAPPLTPRLAFAPVTPPAPATAAPAPENQPASESEPIDALESTRVVRHDDELDDSLLATRVVHHDADDGPEAPVAVDPGLDDDADDTRVVRRRDRRENPDTPASDPLPDDGDTLIRERPALTDGPEAPFAPASGGGRRGGQLPTTRRALRAQRTPVVLPAGLPPSARAAEAPGVDVVESYRPRPIPAPPEPGPELPTGPEATRAEAPSMHSVSRASRRAGWGAVAAIAGACVVSVVGLVVVALAVFAG
jgi:hypothetical protein